jgi:hypothetical protein
MRVMLASFAILSGPLLYVVVLFTAIPLLTG